ncbi:hypothetical protein AOLI_G00154530 [Acnodon oligacanthus]
MLDSRCALALALRCYQCIPELFGHCTDTLTYCPHQCDSKTVVLNVALPQGSPNGKLCYACSEDGCSETVRCEGDQDRCISATAERQTGRTESFDPGHCELPWHGKPAEELLYQLFYLLTPKCPMLAAPCTHSAQFYTGCMAPATARQTYQALVPPTQRRAALHEFNIFLLGTTDLLRAYDIKSEAVRCRYSTLVCWYQVCVIDHGVPFTVSDVLYPELSVMIALIGGGPSAQQIEGLVCWASHMCCLSWSSSSVLRKSSNTNSSKTSKQTNQMNSEIYIRAASGPQLTFHCS